MSWACRDDSNHYTKPIWPPREELAVGRYNVKHTPLIDPRKVYLPPLHIKLGLMKNFVKAMDHHGKGFQYLLEKFGPKKSGAKLKADVFVGLDIRDLIKDEKFDQHINSLELSTWKPFKQVLHNFLGSKKSENYADVVQEILIAYQKLGCRMLLNISCAHTDFFRDNLGDVSTVRDRHVTKKSQTIE